MNLRGLAYIPRLGFLGGLLLGASTCAPTVTYRSGIRVAASAWAWTADDLVGVWATACGPTADAGLTYTIAAGGTAEAIITTGPSAGTCTGEAQLRILFTYDIVGDYLAISGAKKANYTVTQAFFTPVSGPEANTQNMNAYCGLTNWSAGIEQDITGLGCSGYTDLVPAYTIYQKVGDRFTVGRTDPLGDMSDDGSSDALRHRDLNPNLIVERVP